MHTSPLCTSLRHAECNTSSYWGWFVMIWYNLFWEYRFHFLFIEIYMILNVQQQIVSMFKCFAHQPSMFIQCGMLSATQAHVRDNLLWYVMICYGMFWVYHSHFTLINLYNLKYLATNSFNVQMFCTLCTSNAACWVQPKLTLGMIDCRRDWRNLCITVLLQCLSNCIIW